VAGPCCELLSRGPTLKKSACFPVSLYAAFCCRLPVFVASKGQEKGNARGLSNFPFSSIPNPRPSPRAPHACVPLRGLPPLRPFLRAAVAFAALRLRPSSAPSPTSPTSGSDRPFLYVTFATRRLVLVDDLLARTVSGPAKWAFK